MSDNNGMKDLGRTNKLGGKQSNQGGQWEEVSSYPEDGKHEPNTKPLTKERENKLGGECENSGSASEEFKEGFTANLWDPDHISNLMEGDDQDIQELFDTYARSTSGVICREDFENVCHEMGSSVRLDESGFKMLLSNNPEFLFQECSSDDGTYYVSTPLVENMTGTGAIADMPNALGDDDEDCDECEESINRDGSIAEEGKPWETDDEDDEDCDDCDAIDESIIWDRVVSEEGFGARAAPPQSSNAPQLGRPVDDLMDEGEPQEGQGEEPYAGDHGIAGNYDEFGGGAGEFGPESADQFANPGDFGTNDFGLENGPSMDAAPTAAGPGAEMADQEGFGQDPWAAPGMGSQPGAGGMGGPDSISRGGTVDDFGAGQFGDEIGDPAGGYDEAGGEAGWAAQNAEGGPEHWEGIAGTREPQYGEFDASDFPPEVANELQAGGPSGEGYPYEAEGSDFDPEAEFGHDPAHGGGDFGNDDGFEDDQRFDTAPN